MHYNNKYEREKIQELDPNFFAHNKSKVMSFINLCIYPHRFDVVYNTLQTQERVSEGTYEATKGSIMGLLVLVDRRYLESIIAVDEYVIDFIRFIRSDKTKDPVKFLLSMKAYMYRFMFITGLRVAYGIDWREFVFDVLSLDRKPQSISFHSLFTGTYIRNLLQAYTVWKLYREPTDSDYILGENDIVSLLNKTSALKTSLGREKLQLLVEAFQNTLPSWSTDVRRKACYAIDTCQDGTSVIYRQFSDWRYKQTQG